MKTSSNKKAVGSEKTHSSSEDHKETQEKKQEKCDTDSKPETVDQKTEEPVQKEEDSQGSKEPGEIEDSNQDSKNSDTKEEKKIIKRKPTLSGGYVERVLSEGETSTSYESVSSINSSSHFDDFSDAPSDNEDLEENENSACDNLQKSKQKYYREDKSKERNSRSEDFLSSSSGRRLADGAGSSSRHESWRKGCEDREFRLQKTDKWLREQNFHKSRDELSPDQASSHCSENRSNRNRRFRRRRHTNQRVSPRRSRDREHHRGVSGSGNQQRRRNSKHRSRRDSRESRSPIYKVRKGARYPRAISRPSSSSYRDFPNEASTSRASPTIVWEHLDNSGRPDKFKKRQSRRAFLEEQNRKKEELNNLLTDLKIKLKQARRDLQMSRQNNPNGGGFRPEQGNSSRSDDNQNANNDNNAYKIPVIPPSRNTQNVNPEVNAYRAPQPQPFAINEDDPYMPKMSLDNLPLIPGDSGLPIYLTETGEEILHDMDGRQIPIGPNGLYLPLDPSGRLFPHIISPRNQAVPIHMSEDGVLRLPNLDPIPVGPLHNLPVNVDGNPIPVGLDSRPLIPCPNFPTEPPLELMRMAQSFPEYYAQEPADGSFAGLAAEVGETQIAQAHSQVTQAEGQVEEDHSQTAQDHSQTAQDHSQTAQDHSQMAQDNGQMAQDLDQMAQDLDQMAQDPDQMAQDHDQMAQDLDQMAQEHSHMAQAHYEVAHSSAADPSLPSSSGLSTFNQNPREECSTSEQRSKYQKRGFERSEDGCKRKDKGKNLGGRRSKGHVKRSFPVRTDPRRASDKSSSDNDMMIDSTDSDSSYEDENYTKWTDVPSVAEVVTFLRENFCDKDDAKDSSPPGPEPKEAIIRNVERAIKALRAKNYKPPTAGRFILTGDEPEILPEQTPNVSPLLRNRVQLPFITPNTSSSSSTSEARTATSPVINFRFLDLEKKSRAKGGKSSGPKPGSSKSAGPKPGSSKSAGPKPGSSKGAGPKPGSSKRASPPRSPTPTFDRGTQCDFTTEVISNLTSRISELEMEIAHLRNVNANLLDSYRSIQSMSERKKEELEKAISEIQKRNEEILNLKRIIEKKKSQC